MRRFGLLGLVLLPLLLAVFAIGGVLFLRQGGFAPYRVPAGAPSVVAATSEILARGEYVARLGNCASCHTMRGGSPFSGGRAFATGYGTIYSTNLTPDPQSGLGDWSVEEFRHAMRNGVSRHGVLYPVFPYAHFALMDDADLDALFTWLRQLPATRRTPMPNQLEFPASWRPALVVWRMLHYRPANAAVADAGETPPMRRGRYLVEGLGHCAMCHGTRGSMGALSPQGNLAGGRIPGLGWYAPSLDASQLRRYSINELADYLRSGTSAHGTAYGPMAEVVYGSLRHLKPDDALAIATFLKSVPTHAPARASAFERSSSGGSGSGTELYKHECESCHAPDGRGTDKGPPLVDAVAVTAPDPANAIRMILYGGMAPTTAGNPRPYSMPPFVQQLTSAQIGTLTGYIRSTWGGQSSNLSAGDVDALHGIDLD